MNPNRCWNPSAHDPPGARRKSAIPPLLCAIAASFLLACASGGPVATPESGAVTYRSNNYIVYRSSSPETAPQLAERFLGDARKSWVIEEANRATEFRAGAAVVVPLHPRNRGGLYREGVQTVPVLTYHRFGEDCDSPLCMPADVFSEQMQYLKDNGYHSVTPEELLAFLQYREPLPRKSVWITMDDGYRSVYQIAYPILKRLGFTATLFIYTDFVGVSRLAVTWDQLRELRADGFSIGSHSVSHSDLTKPQPDETAEAFLARVRRELAVSKQIIDRQLDQDTFVFAYPFGYHDQSTANQARAAGYQLAVSVRRGGNPFFSNPYTLHRDQVLKKDMSTFVSRLKTFYPLVLE
jgi:peptidoglycan/xylan/chitin deacetylase (PgdA/CDA1 family)